MKTPGADALLRYRLLRPLGPTRFGNAQLALLRDEGRSKGFFALELLREDWAQDTELRSSFLAEAARTLHFEHPNVVRSQEVLAASEVCGRVTRWFAGQSLAAVLERMGRAQFPLHLHVRVLCEVLAALQYLHELELKLQEPGPGAALHLGPAASGPAASGPVASGPAASGPGQAGGGRLVYRDTAPARVLITYTGQVKIVGAGFERTINEIERRSGVLFSDLDYASPELCLGYPAAPSADVYSAGVMLWEALARARRVFADTAEAKVRLRINGEEPDVDQFRRGVPERLAQICRRALAVSPRDRYASAQELQIDLESFLADTETDAQQNAGLGALAELMGQHFAAERAEMLTFIEQQLAEPEPGLPPSSVASGSATRARGAGAGLVESSSSPLAPRRLELAAEEQEALEDAGEGPTELMPMLEPARWDEHTHTVTSFEELEPVDPDAGALTAGERVAGEPTAAEIPAVPPPSRLLQPPELAPAEFTPEELMPDELMAEQVMAEQLIPEQLIPEQLEPHALLQDEAAVAPASQSVFPPPAQGAPLPAEPAGVPRFLQLPVREPDTSGHRAYSSTLRPAPQAGRSVLRTAAPVALAAALVLSIGYGIRVARNSASSAGAAPASGKLEREPAPSAVSNTALPLQAAHEVVEVVHPSALAEVGTTAPALAGSEPAAVSPPASPGGATPPAVPAEQDIVEQIGEQTAEQTVERSAEQRAQAPAAPSGGSAAPQPSAPPEAAAPGQVAAATEAAGAAAGEPSAEPQPEPPPLSVEELMNGEEPRPAPRARRSRAKPADGRGARSSAPQPRVIDETDPYLD